jgi:Large extracellular alpha-helical protein
MSVAPFFVRIKKGIKSYGDYILAKTFEQIVTVPEMPKELTILHDGSILSLAGKRTISIMARDIDTVKFDLGRVLPSQINHLVSQTYGTFQKPDFNYKYYFNEDNLTDRFEEVRVLQKLEKGKSQYLSFDFSPYLQSANNELRGLFFFKVSGWDAEKKQTTDPEDKRFILITDLGVVVKTAVSGASDLFVVSLSIGKPVEGAQVDALGKNGLPIANAVTNAQGHAMLPSLKDFEREKTPTVFLVRKGKDLSFIPYNRNDRELNLSRFEIGGRYSAESPDELNAYLFSDRGIYRPGDAFHVGIILKSPVWEKNIAGVPLKACIIDPGSRKISEKTIALSPSGFEEIAYTTQENSPTGNYEISVYIVDEEGHPKKKIGSTTIRVEEFLPDHLRISAQLSKMSAEGWVSPRGLKGVVNLQNLFGTPAADRLITGKIQLTPCAPAFRAYPDYLFFDPLKADHVYTESVPEGRTDEQGNAQLDLDLKRFKDATYRLTFLAEGYEAEGGRAVRAQISVLVSPNEYLIGYKPDGNLNYIARESKRSAHLIAVNPDLKMTAAQNLKANLVERRYVSVLTKQESGVYKYQSVEKEITVSNEKLVIPEQGLRYQFPTKQPGDYALIVKNDRDIELSRIPFSVVGDGDLSRSLEKNAELQVKLNKKDFGPGEHIEMEIRAPYTGAGLITIEQDKVYAFKWFTTKSTNTVQNITVVDLLPGGFEVELNPGIERTTQSEGLWGASRLQKIYHWQPQNVDIREDRVVVFGEVSPEV